MSEFVHDWSCEPELSSLNSSKVQLTILMHEYQASRKLSRDSKYLLYAMLSRQVDKALHRQICLTEHPYKYFHIS